MYIKAKSGSLNLFNPSIKEGEVIEIVKTKNSSLYKFTYRNYIEYLSHKGYKKLMENAVEGKPEVIVKKEIKQEVKPEVKQEIKPEVKAEIKKPVEPKIRKAKV